MAQRNDNKEQERGNFYKVLVAIKYALEKSNYNELIIEHKGDVTFDNSIQIEVKQVKAKLSNVRKEFWNTLYNWLTEEANAKFEEFILHTTQKLTKDTFFHSWGKNSNTDLHRIKQVYRNEIIDNPNKDSSKYYYNEIFNVGKFTNKQILETIKRVKIKHSQSNDELLIKEIAEKYKISISENKEIFVRKYLGGTIYSEVAGRGKWILTKEQFFRLSQNEVSKFIENPKQKSYSEYIDREPTEKQITNYYNKKFVLELQNISCEDYNITEAITDYWRTNSLIIELQEFDERFINQEFKKYQKGKVYKKLRNEKDRIKPTNDNENNNALSLDFYKDAKTWQAMKYESIPDYEYIQHGTMHRIIEDEDGENFNFKWLIEKK